MTPGTVPNPFRFVAWAACAIALGSCVPETAHQHPEGSPDWENPTVFDIGKERPHATFSSFPDRESALSLGRSESPRYRSLNGSW